MISLRHETLPAGLSAVLRRTADGGVDIVVSSALSAGRQRAAVRMALRAARPANRRAALLPGPALAMLALARAWLRPLRHGHVLHLASATVAVTAAAAAAIVVVTLTPHQHQPALAGQPPAGGVPVPPPGRSSPAVTPRPGAAPPSRQPGPSGPPLQSAGPAAAPSASTQPGQAASPSAAVPSPPSATPGQPVPQPSASPSASPGPPGSGGRGGAACLDLLGIWVCL